jgi:hypothetical protein
VYFRDDGTLRFADASGIVVAKANDPEHARRLAACWNAFLQAATRKLSGSLGAGYVNPTGRSIRRARSGNALCARSMPRSAAAMKIVRLRPT